MGNDITDGVSEARVVLERLETATPQSRNYLDTVTKFSEAVTQHHRLKATERRRSALQYVDQISLIESPQSAGPHQAEPGSIAERGFISAVAGSQTRLEDSTGLGLDPNLMDFQVNMSFDAVAPWDNGDDLPFNLDLGSESFGMYFDFTI